MSKASSLQTWLLVLGLLLCAGLAVALVQARAERSELAASAGAITREAAEFEQRAKLLWAEVMAMAEAESAQRWRAARVLPPAERARWSVGALVQSIKAQHVLQPPPLPPPDPPVPPDGGLGMVFPELMGDPEYARGVFLMQRNQVDREHRKVLEALGCDARMVEEALNLLTERALVRYDVRSLDPNTRAGPGAGPFEQSLRVELEQQLHQLLGDTRYAQFLEPDVILAMSVMEDGSRRKTLRPGIPLVRLESRQRYLVNPLVTRLAYSDAPLPNPQKEELIAALTRLARTKDRRTPPSDSWSDPDVIEVFRNRLSPGQFAAVEELQAEAAAYQQRAKLAKQ